MIDIEGMHGQIDRKVAELVEVVEGRDREIARLQAQNAETQQQIASLQETGTQIAGLVAQLANVAELLTTMAPDPAAPVRRARIDKLVLPIIEAAGPAGIDGNDIIAKAPTLRAASVRAFLSQAKKAGKLEHVSRGVWRMKVTAAEPSTTGFGADDEVAQEAVRQIERAADGYRFG